MAEGVVDLKAQYGIDTDANGRITDSSAPNEWMKAAPADWTRVRAIRVALLVRSRNYEKPPASAQEASWVASNPAWSGGNFVMKNVDGTPDSAAFGDPNNWRHYRYRVYERDHPAAQRDLEPLIMSRRPRRSPAARCATASRQQGVVLFVALIVLVVMALAGVAMMRQSGSGLSIAGNIGMKQNATAAGDFGTETAIAWWLVQRNCPACSTPTCPARATSPAGALPATRA